MQEVKLPMEAVIRFARKWSAVVVLASFYVFYIAGIQKEYQLSVWLSLLQKTDVGISLRLVFLEPFLYPFKAIGQGWLLFFAIVAGIFVHEGIHGLVAALFAKKGFPSVSFGFNREYLAPFTHCNEPLTIHAYRLVLLSPLLLMGILPMMASFILLQAELFVFSLVYILGAMGDVYVYISLNKYKGNQHIKDHPDTLGYFINSQT